MTFTSNSDGTFTLTLSADEAAEYFMELMDKTEELKAEGWEEQQ